MLRLVGILGLFFSIFFMVVALTIIFNQWLPIPEAFPETIKENSEIYNYLVGVLVMGYGIFRFIRSYHAIRHNQES